MSQTTDAYVLAAEIIEHIEAMLNGAITKLHNTDTLHPRTKLMATRQLIPLHEQLKTEVKKLKAMSRQNLWEGD